jgi:hypothetical protein
VEVCSNDYWGEGKNEKVGIKKGRKREVKKERKKREFEDFHYIDVVVSFSVSVLPVATVAVFAQCFIFPFRHSHAPRITSSLLGSRVFLKHRPVLAIPKYMLAFSGVTLRTLHL